MPVQDWFSIGRNWECSRGTLSRNWVYFRHVVNLTRPFGWIPVKLKGTGSEHDLAEAVLTFQESEAYLK